VWPSRCSTARARTSDPRASTRSVPRATLLYFWPRQNQRMPPAQHTCAGFRKFSGKNSCISRARRARAGLTVNYPPSRTLELLAFDEYCRFDTSAFF
jgi:hypothetical protein